MDARLFLPIFILFLITPGCAAAQDYPGFPNTIMAPERGSVPHRVETSKRTPKAHAAHTARTPNKQRYGRRRIARGSSGSVLPTPLPRTSAIPPEGRGVLAVHTPSLQQAPTVVPGLGNPVPNLPHGAESFQDRASRCAFQQGLYNVPGTMRTQYMGACLQ